MLTRRHHHGQVGPGRNTHTDAVVSIFAAGSSRVELGGGDWKLGAGDVLLVPAGAPHRMVEARQVESWTLALDERFGPLDRVREGASPVIAIPGGRQGWLGSLLAELERAPGDGPVARSLRTLVLAEIAAAAPAVGIIDETLRFIEAHCLRPLGLAEVAAAIGRSPAHLTTIVRRATGRSVGQWIMHGRVVEAERLLLQSNGPVDEIAARVGYADATHFTRLFRRVHGVTPAMWRARRSPGGTGVPSHRASSRRSS